MDSDSGIENDTFDAVFEPEDYLAIEFWQQRSTEMVWFMKMLARLESGDFGGNIKQSWSAVVRNTHGAVELHPGMPEIIFANFGIPGKSPSGAADDTVWTNIQREARKTLVLPRMQLADGSEFEYYPKKSVQGTFARIFSLSHVAAIMSTKTVLFDGYSTAANERMAVSCADNIVALGDAITLLRELKDDVVKFAKGGINKQEDMINDVCYKLSVLAAKNAAKQMETARLRVCNRHVSDVIVADGDLLDGLYATLANDTTSDEPIAAAIARLARQVPDRWSRLATIKLISADLKAIGNLDRDAATRLASIICLVLCNETGDDIEAAIGALNLSASNEKTPDSTESLPSLDCTRKCSRCSRIITETLVTCSCEKAQYCSENCKKAFMASKHALVHGEKPKRPARRHYLIPYVPQ